MTNRAANRRLAYARWTLLELHELRRGLELREVDIASKIDAHRVNPASIQMGEHAERFTREYVINRSLHTAICERILEVEMVQE